MVNFLAEVYLFYHENKKPLIFIKIKGFLTLSTLFFMAMNLTQISHFDGYN